MPNPSSIAMEDEAKGRTLNFRGTGYLEDEGGADRTRPFYYLAGPMTGIPANNFPEFNRAAESLRELGFNILNPAELGDEKERAAAEASKDGTDNGVVYGELWQSCLLRDLRIVGHPNCAGIICIDGWEASEGAQWETYTAVKLRKPIFKFGELGLLRINRRKALEKAGVIDG